MRETTTALDPKDLSAIMMLQSIIQIIDDNRKLAEVVSISLCDLSCIKAAALELDEELLYIASEHHLLKDQLLESIDVKCNQIKPEYGIFISIPLQTAQKTYGRLYLLATSPVDYSAYSPYLQNTANSLALLIENRKQADELKELNRQLKTSLKEKTNKLAESENRFFGIAKTVPGVVFQFRVRKDKSSYISYISPQCEELFSLSQEALRDDWIFGSRIHPDDRASFLLEVENAIENRTQWYYEGRILQEDGSIKWFQGISIPSFRGDELVYDGVLIDITKSKSAYEALKKSEEKLEKTFNNSPAAIVITSYPDSTILDANQGFYNICGFTPQETIGKRTYELNLWAEPDKREQYIKVLSEEGKIKDIEAKFRMKSGEIHTFLYSAEIIEIQDIKYLLSIAYDITDLHRATKAMEESEQRYRTLFEADDRAIILTTNTKMIDCNPAAIEIFRSSKEYFLTKHPFSIIPTYQPDGRLSKESASEKFKTAESAGTQHFQFRFLRDDQTEFDAEVMLKRIMISGSPHILAIIRDITEQKKTEEKLQYNQTILTKVLNSIPQAVFWKDINSVFLGCNEVFSKIIGTDHPDDLTGKNDLDFTSNKKDALAYQTDDRLVMDRKRPLFNIVETVTKADGTEIWVNTTKVPLMDANGEVFGVLGVFEDITERREAEEKLQEKINEIERFNKLATHREGRIIELKSEINRLAAEAGKPLPHPSISAALQNDENIEIEEEITLDLKNLKFEEILDVEQLQCLMDTLCSSLGFSMSIISPEGKVLKKSQWKKVCSNFYRINKITEDKCIKSDTNLANQVQKGKDYAFYECQNGINAAASPIIINGRHIASIFIGQFFTKEPNISYFKRQAQEYGFDETSFIAGIKEVPVFDERTIKLILTFITELASLITNLSLNSLKIKTTEKAIKNRAEELNKRRAAALSLAEDAEQARREIAEYKDRLEELVRERTTDLDDARMAALSLMQDANIQRQRVEDTLAEKEVLLREIHHRVKNNLNSISNLLYLQSRSITDKHTASALQESQNRIHSMARVHEHLYRSQNIAKIDIQSYLEEMTADLSQSLSMNPVIMKVEASDIMLDVDRAIPFGLLVNELITNSLKHAFGGKNNHNVIIISLILKKESYILEVSDNGDGLPVDFDIKNVKSLGLKLVTMLTKQLQGTFRYESAEGHGTLFRVVFPE